MSVLGIGGAVFLIPLIFPTSNLQEELHYVGTLFSGISPILVVPITLLGTFIIYILGESFITSGALVREWGFASEGFDESFALAALSNAPMLIDEYRHTKDFIEVCDGVFAVLVIGVVTTMWGWKLLDQIGYFILGISFTIAISQPFAAAVALRRFDRKLLLYIKLLEKKNLKQGRADDA